MAIDPQLWQEGLESQEDREGTICLAPEKHCIMSNPTQMDAPLAYILGSHAFCLCDWVVALFPCLQPLCLT